jgi:hypothetical protein
MNARSAVKLLLGLTLALPVLFVVLLWVAGLLSAMGDEGAAAVLGHVNTALRIVWLVGIVGLVIALATQTLDQDQE